MTHARVDGKEAVWVRDKERIFCEEFLIDLNAYAAAVRAGYSDSYARDAAKWIHPEHPEKPKLRAEIDRLMALRSRRVGIHADRVLVELGKLAFANFGNIVDRDTGGVFHDAAEDDLAAVAGIRVKSGKFDEREVHLYDKLRALELIGRHLGMFDEKARREEGEQSSVAKVAELMARLDAEARAAALDSVGQPPEEGEIKGGRRPTSGEDSRSADPAAAYPRPSEAQGAGENA